MTDGDTRVVIVEDHVLLGQTVGLALRAEGVEVTVAPIDSTESVLATVKGAAPCLVLLDLDLGDLGDGVALIPSLVDSDAIVLVVTGVVDRVRLGTAVEAGAVGYVIKDQPFDTLIGTAIRAAAGETVLDQNDRQELLAEVRRARAARDRRLAPFASLTPREEQVLHAIAEGKSVEAIAEEWFVSPATVRTQVRGVLTKLDVNSQLAAVAKARQSGWLSR